MLQSGVEEEEEALREAQAGVEEAEKRKALAFWRNNAVIVCFGAWLQHTEEETIKRKLMARIAIRMLRLRLSAAMWRWCESLRETVRQKAKTRKTLAFWRNKAIVTCFGAWFQHAARKTRKRNVVETKTRKALSFWRKKVVVGGLGAWHQHAAEETRKRNVLKRIVKRMLSRQLSAAMWRWYGSLKARVREEAKTRKVLAFWRKKATVGAFGAWRQHAGGEARKRNIMERVVKRMLRRRLSAAMRRWCETLQQRVRVQTKTRKALAIWRNKASVLSFGAWQQHAGEETRKKNVMERIVKRMLSRALQMWARISRHAARSSRVLGKALKRWGREGVARALGGWKSAAAACRRLDVCGERVRMRAGAACGRAALHVWRAVLLEHRNQTHIRALALQECEREEREREARTYDERQQRVTAALEACLEHLQDSLYRTGVGWASSVSLSLSLDAKASQLAEMEQRLLASMREQEGMESSVNAAKQALEEVEEMLLARQREAAEVAASAASSQDSASMLDRAVSEREAALRESEARLDCARAELEALQCERLEILSHSQVREERLQEDMEALQQEIESLQKRHVEERKRVEEERERVLRERAVLEGSVEGLREECLQLERERKKMAEEQGALHTSVGELREEHARLEEEREKMAQEQERMAKEKHALQRSLVKLEEEVVTVTPLQNESMC
jgi:hypothetical protein